MFVEVSEENAFALVKTFRDFGFPEGVEKDLFLAKGKMIRVGRPPLRLEILTQISGVTFEECYPECIREEIDGVEVCFIDFDNLIKNKRATGRPHDQLDANHLTKDRDGSSQPST